MAFLEKTVALGTTDTEVYACPATLSGSAHGLVFSNITSASHTITIKLYSQLTGLTTQVTSSGQVVPANSQFTWAKPINMIAGDKIIASADTVSSIVAVVAVYLDQAAQPSSAFVPRGDWSAVANYAVNDIVSSGSSSYVAVTTNLNSSPPSANWMLLAASTAALPLSGGTMTGAIAFVAGQIFRETKVSLAANNFDLAAGAFYSKTISGATTLTVSNTPASGNPCSFILNLTNGGSSVITWWAGVKWAGGTAPTLTTSGRDRLGFITEDGGTIWDALVLGKDLK